MIADRINIIRLLEFKIIGLNSLITNIIKYNF